GPTDRFDHLSDYVGTPYNVTATQGAFNDPNNSEDPEPNNPADDVKIAWTLPTPMDGQLEWVDVWARDSSGNWFHACSTGHVDTTPAANQVFCVWDPGFDDTWLYRVSIINKSGGSDDYS